MKKRLQHFPRKLAGSGTGTYKPLSAKHLAWSVITAISAILALIAISRLAECELLIAPFAASAVLAFGEYESPLAQPRNLVGGHVVSAAAGVGIGALFGHALPATALAVGVAILFMHLTRTTHPPGGATAFLAVQGKVGASFILIPVLAGCLILLVLALFTNNIVHHRRYPRHWI